MSKKTSAFQVYSEDQVHQRHARTYRAGVAGSQTTGYKSPPLRSSRGVGVGWRDDAMDTRGARSPSPEVRRDRLYDKYDHRRADTAYTRDRYSDDGRRDDSPNRLPHQPRYRSDTGYDSHTWDRDDRHDDRRDDRRDDYSADRGVAKRRDSYLIVDARREGGAKAARAAQYTDSDEEALHESLRRKKPLARATSSRQWSSDDDDFGSLGQDRGRKRTVSDTSYHSPPSRTAAKGWRDHRHYSSDDDRHDDRRDAGRYSDYADDSDRGRPSDVAPASKKKKVKASKKNGKSKEKKRKAVGGAGKARGGPAKCGGGASKLPSLLDLEIPGLVSPQVEGATPALPRFGQSRAEFKFSQRHDDGHRDDDRGWPRRDDTRGRPHYDADHYARQRDSSFSRRGAESDRKGQEVYSGHRSPDYSRRLYPSDDDLDRDREGQGRPVYRDGRGSVEFSAGSKRKRQGSLERRDWARSGNRSNKDRSPDSRAYSDSDQDSDRDGGRRAWRDERRDRPAKKRDEEGVKGQKGEKKVKAKTAGSKEVKEVKRAAVKDKEEADTAPGRLQVLTCTEGLAIVMTHPHQLCLRGRATIKVIAGEVSVMGHRMEVKDTTYDLFSPTCSSLLTITTCSAETDKKTVRRAVRSLGVEEKAPKDWGGGAVVVLARRLEHHAADFICSYPPFAQLFRHTFDRGPLPLIPPPADDKVKVGATFVTSDQAMTSVLRVSDDFEAALSRWTDVVKDKKAPIVVLCGGVNSGKSTFSRYLVNATLDTVPNVGYLDCDVGQTEFSPPGAVALTIVDEAVFGPPFCHQRVAQSMCFLGLVSTADGPSRYVRCVQHVLEAYHQMEPPLPLIVNTMGWHEGLGLKLFVDVLHLLTPDLVVQFNMAASNFNFPPITPQFPLLESGWTFNTDPVGDPP